MTFNDSQTDISSGWGHQQLLNENTDEASNIGWGWGEISNGGYSSSSEKNELGFHGEITPNPNIEDKLFRSSQSQMTGINFDKVNIYNYFLSRNFRFRFF